MRIELLSVEQLAERGVPAVRTYLAEVRRATAQLAGAEAVALEAMDRLDGPRREPPPPPAPPPEPPAASDNEPPADDEGEKDTPDDAGPEPPPAPKPSAKQRREAELRSLRLRRFPDVRRALEQGRISDEQADLLTESGLDADVIAELLRLAITHSDTDQTREQVKAARTARDEDDPVKALWRQVIARGGGVRVDDDGMVRFWGALDPVTGAPLLDAFHRMERELYHRHDKHVALARRTARQRGADALALLFGLTPPDPKSGPIVGQRMGTATPSTAQPRDGRRTPTVPSTKHVMHLILNADRQRPGKGAAYTMNGQVLPPSLVDGLFDDAELHAWTIDSLGNPIGHATGRRHATKIQRLALALRDGGCVWAGCRRPHGACDAHHMDEWAVSQDSRLVNLALLCPQHHQQLHQMGCRLRAGPEPHSWQIITTDGRVVSEWTNPAPPWLN